MMLGLTDVKFGCGETVAFQSPDIGLSSLYATTQFFLFTPRGGETFFYGWVSNVHFFLLAQKETNQRKRAPRCSLLPNACLFPSAKVGVMRRPGAAHLKNASMHFFLWPKENALGALKWGNKDGSLSAAPLLDETNFDCAAEGKPSN